jgi:transposase-like protein
MAHPGGRPTLYHPDMCDQVVESLREGASIEEIGLDLGVGYTTVYRWMDEHEEFRQAVSRGRELSKGWWFKKGRTHIENREFNSTLWYMNMKNRHGWSDKQEISANLEVGEKARNNIDSYGK